MRNSSDPFRLKRISELLPRTRTRWPKAASEDGLGGRPVASNALANTRILRGPALWKSQVVALTVKRPPSPSLRQGTAAACVIL